MFERGLVILKSLVKPLPAGILPLGRRPDNQGTPLIIMAKRQRGTRAKIFAGDFCAVFKIN